MTKKRFMDFRSLITEAEPAPQQTNQPQQAPEQPLAAPAPEPSVETQPESETASMTDPRSSLATKIKPACETAKAVIAGIQSAFADDCGKTTKYNRVGDQIKNLEKQVRGACQQVISFVEQDKFNWKDNNQCSPTSYGVIKEYDSRDFDCVKLSAALIVFYNSLTGKN